MNQRLKKSFSGLFLVLLMITTPTQASAQDWGGKCVYQEVATIKGLECLFERLITYAVSFIGLALLVMIFVGAFRILSSGGDPKGVASGKDTITYAILGLILALSAWFILNLIANFTGAGGITTFEIPQ